MSVPQLVATSDMISTVPFSLGVWYADAGLKLLRSRSPYLSSN
jgi:hypothetical protein